MPPRIFTMPQTDQRVPAAQLWYNIVQTGEQLSTKLSASWYSKHKQAGFLLKNFLQNSPDPLVHEVIKNKLVAFKSSTDNYRVTELMSWLQTCLPQTQEVAQADLDTLYVNPDLKAAKAAQGAPETTSSKAIHLWTEIIKSGRILSDKLATSWYAKNKHAAVLIKEFINYPPYTWQPNFLYGGLEQFAQSARANNLLEVATWAESWLKRFYKEGNTYGIYLTVKVDFATQLVLLNKALLQFIRTARGKLTTPQIGSIGDFQTHLQAYCQDTLPNPGAINKTGYFAILEHFVSKLHGEHLTLRHMLEEHSHLPGAKESLAILYQWLAFFYHVTPGSAIGIRNKKDAYQFSRLYFEFDQLMQWLRAQIYSRDPVQALYATKLIKILKEFTTATLCKASIDNTVEDLACKISQLFITHDAVIMQKIKNTILKLTFLDGNIIDRCNSQYLSGLYA